MQFGDYSDYEQQSAKIRSENKALLDGFETWLEQSGLKEKTIRKHIGNVDFYINEYLLYGMLIRPQEGVSLVDEFFNRFFPRKVMWSNVTNTKETVAGLKKFYRFLVDTGSVDDADYRQFLAEVKSGMPEWLEHYRYLDEW